MLQGIIIIITIIYHSNPYLITRRELEFKIYHLNVQSFFSKKEQLRTLVHDLVQNCIFFTETELCENDDTNLFNPDKE